MRKRSLGLGAALVLASAASLRRGLGRVRGRARATLADPAVSPPAHEDAVGANGRQFRRVVDGVDHVIFEVDHFIRLSFLNRAWQDLSGHDVPASVGQPLLDFLHPDDRPVAGQRCGELLAGQRESIAQDLRLLTRDGTVRWTAVHARPLMEGGVCRGVAGTISDITARRHAEQDLERARVEAEHASAAKSEFLRSMSHEMRTPLNGVLGVLELLAGTPLDPQQARYVAAARASGTHLATLISDILDLSTLDSGAFAVERHLFDLPDLIESSLDVVAAEASHKRLRLSCTTTADVPTWVIGDPGRLRQVLVNLLANAVKFTERGEVHVQAGASAGDPGRPVMLRLDVQDTGMGMAPDQMDRLFLPFTPGDVSRTRRHSGTGLGLTICKRLVDAMQGSIEARSVQGGGSTFTVTLPLEVPDAATLETERQARVAPPAARVDAVRPTWPRPLRVLVAEDHDINQLVVREMLGSMGLAADLVGDGEAAVDAALAVPYDVIIMDCQMPVLDGLEATRRIREAQAQGLLTHAPRIIALTANATAEDRRACLAAGMDAYLTKPVRSAVLQRTLLRLTAEPHPPVASTVDPPTPARGAVRPPVPDGMLAHTPGAEDILDPAEVLLRCNNNGDLGARMLELFAASLPSELALLDAAAAADDPAALERIAHKVRGAAATLAATRLAGAIAGLEHFLKHGDDGPLAERLADVRRESALLLGAIPQIVGRLHRGSVRLQG